MDGYKQQRKEWDRAYQRISSLTNIPVENLFSRCLVLVKDGSSPYYGRIGILEHQDFHYKNGRARYVVNFGERRRVKFDLEFSFFNFGGIGKKFFYTPNAPLLLEEKDKIGWLPLV
jgi:hypothetical protein